MAIYSQIKKIGDKYIVKLPNREVEVKDEICYLDYFANGGSIDKFMSNIEVWGEDLSKFTNFKNIVISNVNKIIGGEELL